MTFQTHTTQKLVRGKIAQKKISISIPYKKRLENLELVLEALSQQTMDKDDFEVIIGAMEYCEKYISLCKNYINKLNIITVMSSEEFAIPWARNLAMRQASGQVIVQMDADTLLPPNSLQNLYESHFAFAQEVCIVGQVIGYGNNNDVLSKNIEVLPFSAYKEAIYDLESSSGNPKDPRFQVHHAIPWAFGWTGLIAIPLNIIRKHNLYFDETFEGWGIDDLEWSFRICKSKIPIILSEKVRAIHLPHPRDPEANRKTEILNNRRFLLKWPSPDVELQVAFGDVIANSIYLEFIKEYKKITKSLGGKLGIARGNCNGKDTIIIGLELDNKNQILDPNLKKAFDPHYAIDIKPLVGIAVPYPDSTCDECEILNPVTLFSERYTSAIYKEARRVSKKVLLPQSNLMKAS